MVEVKQVRELRPALSDAFRVGLLVPRTEAIARAYEWGKEIHAGQMRFSGEPYFETHCVWVAGLLDKLVANETWTIAALLHDAVEDRGGSLEQIREQFPGLLGEEVAYIVDGVTKLSVPRDGRSRELETLRKLTMFRDPGVFLVKLADKTHNMLTLEHMPAPKQQQKAIEAIRAYGKLAGILNCYQWRRWLEDLAFPYADPETYAYVKEKVDHDSRLQADFLNEKMEQLGKLMERSGISGRVDLVINGYWQSWQKLQRMARKRTTPLTSFEALNDMVSFRLVTAGNAEKDCYTLLSGVNRFFGSYLDQDRFDDYIACPQNGYRALQVTAWLPGRGAIEVAIATEEMEGENHWGVVDAIQKGRDPGDYRPMAILTPTGGVRFLPEGSTVLDAVASIQQEFLLDKISSVEVNGALSRLSDKVKAGDIVEVITGTGRSQPSEEWLSFCNSSTARLVRDVLVTQSLKKSAEQGRQMLRKPLAERGIFVLEDVQVLHPVKVDNLLERLGCASLEDLYIAVGGSALRLEDIAKALDEVGISRGDLDWTTVYLVGKSQSNRPGTLVKLTRLVSLARGNIVRSETNTLPNGDFDLKIIAINVSPLRRETLRKGYGCCGVELKTFEVL